MIEYENEEELDFGADLIEGDLSTNLFEESQKDNTSLIKENFQVADNLKENLPKHLTIKKVTSKEFQPNSDVQSFLSENNTEMINNVQLATGYSSELRKISPPKFYYKEQLEEKNLVKIPFKDRSGHRPLRRPFSAVHYHSTSREGGSLLPMAFPLARPPPLLPLVVPGLPSPFLPRPLLVYSRPSACDLRPGSGHYSPRGRSNQGWLARPPVCVAPIFFDYPLERVYPAELPRKLQYEMIMRGENKDRGYLLHKTGYPEDSNDTHFINRERRPWRSGRLKLSSNKKVSERYGSVPGARSPYVNPRFLRIERAHDLNFRYGKRRPYEDQEEHVTHNGKRFRREDSARRDKQIFKRKKFREKPPTRPEAKKYRRSCSPQNGIKRAAKKNGEVSTTTKLLKDSDKRSVTVANLSAATSPTTLKKMLSSVGIVEHVKFCDDPEIKVTATFAESRGALACRRRYHKHLLDGRVITVTLH